jgi:putative ABC transport system permease protein
LIKMRTLAVRSIRANPVRFVATVLAVLVSTAFLAGTMVLRDSLGAALEASARGQLQGVDAVVQGGPGGAGQPAPSGGPTGTAPGTVPGASGAEVPPAEPGGPGTTVAGGAASQPSTTRRAGDMSGGPNMGQRQLGVDQGVPAETVEVVRRVAGVDEAAGMLSGFISVLDAGGGSISENINGAVWIPEARLNPYRLVEGRAPAAPGEIALDTRTVESGSLQLDSAVQVATSQGIRPAKVVGIVTFGDQPSSGQGDALLAEADGFAWLNDGRRQYTSVYIAADNGVRPDDLVATLRTTLGPGFEVNTGDQLRDEAAETFGGVVDVISGALLGFAIVALFVALFTIYNTFSIIVAQRTREFALLRALGATGQQIRRSVRTEAALLGIGASAVGFLCGVGLFLLLTRLVGQFEDLVGSVSLRISIWSVIAVLAVGVILTMVSAFVPAWRASRTKPLEALRDVAVDRSSTSKLRAIIGLVLLGFGVVVLLAGGLLSNFWLILLGPPALFFGVIIGGPVLAANYARGVEALVKPLRRTSLRLGVENVQRNPRRSAATALALVIGVFLVVLVTAGGGAVRDYAVAQVSRLSGPDVTVIAFSNVLPEDYVRQVRAIDGAAGVAEVYPEAALVEAIGLPASGVDYRDIRALNLQVVAGDLGSLGPNDAVVPDFGPQSGIGTVGDPIRVTFANGQSRDVRIGAVVAPALPFPMFVSSELVNQVDPMLTPASLQIAAESGKVQDVTDEVTRLSRQYSGLEALPGNIFAQVIRSVFNFVIAAANVLLTVAVVIALFGIVNTLVLSVNERTHEIGLLRAVGMTRRQVRATIRLESVAVSLLGALIGTVFGLFVAWCLTRPILNQEGDVVSTGFSWPVAQLLLILVLAVIVGMAASLVPARRASRLNIIDAVRME